MQKLSWIGRRLKILQFLERTPTTYVKFLLWSLIDTPHALHRYRVYKHLVLFVNKLLRGVKVKLDYGEFVVVDGYSLWILTCYEEGIVRMLKRVFVNNPELTFIDIGAHIGKYTVLAGRYLRKGQVLAFEPHPENFEYLVLNVSINRINNAKLFPLALLNKIGFVKMIIADTSGEHSCKYSETKTNSKVINVPAVTLDYVVQRLNLKNVDLIKIDVEGAEIEVLEGAINTLYKFRPHIVMEVWFNNLRQVFIILRRLDYHIVKLDVQQEHMYIYAYPIGEKPLFQGNLS